MFFSQGNFGSMITETEFGFSKKCTSKQVRSSGCNFGSSLIKYELLELVEVKLKIVNWVLDFI